MSLRVRFNPFLISYRVAADTNQTKNYILHTLTPLLNGKPRALPQHTLRNKCFDKTQTPDVSFLPPPHKTWCVYSPPIYPFFLKSIYHGQTTPLNSILYF